MAWAADVAAVEVHGAEVHREDEDSATVEDVEVGEAWAVVVVEEAFLVEAQPGVVVEAASAEGAHRLVSFMVFLALAYTKGGLGGLVAKAGLMRVRDGGQNHQGDHDASR